MWISVIFLCGWMDGAEACRYLDPVFFPDEEICRAASMSRAINLASGTKSEGVLSLGGLHMDCVFVDPGDPEVPA